VLVGWVETTVETQHLSVVCWVLLSRHPTYDYYQVIDFSFLKGDSWHIIPFESLSEVLAKKLS